MIQFFKNLGFKSAKSVCSLGFIGLGAWASAGQTDIAQHVVTPANGQANKRANEQVIELQVDFSQPTRKIIHVLETVPVHGKSVLLHYPKWIPGEHGPSGPIEAVVGLQIYADTHKLDWSRDRIDMYSIHVTLPEHTTKLRLEFDVLASNGSNDGSSPIVATPKLLLLEWNQVLFYPAGHASKDIRFNPSIKLAPQWQYATALRRQNEDEDGDGSGKTTLKRFQEVSLEELVDSPLLTGENFKRIQLNPEDQVPSYLNLAADQADKLAITPIQIEQHQALMRQAVKLFGYSVFRHYDFLHVVSDHVHADGLEHRESSSNRSPADYYVSNEIYLADPTLLAHELVHAWNGKYRRPNGLNTAHYQLAMEGDLLWVYEGLTNYLGEVLTARAGLWNAAQFRDALALTAAEMDHRPGRRWRSLDDTVSFAQTLYHTPQAWASYRRQTDFYREGSLLWLDIDMQLQSLTQGKKSIDDFVKIFHARPAHNSTQAHQIKAYDLKDVITTLNTLAAFDWKQFLHERTHSKEEHAPLAGIGNSGWQLHYDDQASSYFKANEALNRQANYSYSVGLVIARDNTPNSEHGDIIDVLWDGPAFKAGLVPGMRILKINGENFESGQLANAIQDAQKKQSELILTVSDQDQITQLSIPYTEGLRYPHLIPVAGQEDRLEKLIKAR